MLLLPKPNESLVRFSSCSFSSSSSSSFFLVVLLVVLAKLHYCVLAGGGSVRHLPVSSCNCQLPVAYYSQLCHTLSLYISVSLALLIH